MHKLTVTTYYECTDRGWQDYCQMLQQTMPPENYRELMKTGRTERTSVDPDGQTAVTTHQILE